MSGSHCTVVVVALHGGASLEGCLRALVAQGAHCVVMLGPGMPDAAAWGERFAAVRFVDAATLPVPMRRARGIDISDSDVVALLEDSSLPGPGWLSAVRSSFTSASTAAVGGPVTVAAAIHPRQRALGCCEFGAYHPALIRRLALAPDRDRAGLFEVDRLPGNNMAYRRTAVAARGEPHAGLVETRVFAQLRAAGQTLMINREMAVDYRPCNLHGADWATRYGHGRLYGGIQRALRPPAQRVPLVLKALTLPVVLSFRSLRRMMRTVPPADWLRVGAHVCWLETAWAAGEAMGAVAGPGRTMNRWY